MIAALFVREDGPYAGRHDVDLWPESRDARLYAGPYPVVAHPPCARWGRYWSGGPSVKVRRKLGDDAGCFASALASVREWGGVLEHPEASHAFARFDLRRPARKGGWDVDARVSKAAWGWVCCVEQGHYGHPARKATWLYFVGKDAPPELHWGPAPAGVRLDEGFASAEARKAARAAGQRPRKRLTEYQREATPVPFAELLLSLARASEAP